MSNEFGNEGIDDADIKKQVIRDHFECLKKSKTPILMSGGNSAQDNEHESFLCHRVSLSKDHVIFVKSRTSQNTLEFKQGKSLSFYTMPHQGIFFEFDCKYIDKFDKGQQTFIEVSLPNELNQQDRRDNYRIECSVVNKLMVDIIINDLHPFSGWIQDISYTGINLSYTQKAFPKAINEELLLNDTNTTIKLSIPHSDDQISSERIIVELTPLWHKVDSRKKTMNLGGAFKELNATTERKVAEFVSALRRKYHRYY